MVEGRWHQAFQVQGLTNHESSDGPVLAAMQRRGTEGMAEAWRQDSSAVQCSPVNSILARAGIDLNTSVSLSGYSRGYSRC